MSILFSFWKALHRLPGFDIEPGPSPSLGPSQKIELKPSKNGRARAEPEPSLGLDPSLPFFISCYFIFPLINALVYVDIGQGIHYGKNKVAWNEKQKKQLWVFIYV